VGHILVVLCSTATFIDLHQRRFFQRRYQRVGRPGRLCFASHTQRHLPRDPHSLGVHCDAGISSALLRRSGDSHPARLPRAAGKPQYASNYGTYYHGTCTHLYMLTPLHCPPCYIHLVTHGLPRAPSTHHLDTQHFNHHRSLNDQRRHSAYQRRRSAYQRSSSNVYTNGAGQHTQHVNASTHQRHQSIASTAIPLPFLNITRTHDTSREYTFGFGAVCGFIK
jgi:hypothetical protein